MVCEGAGSSESYFMIEFGLSKLGAFYFGACVTCCLCKDLNSFVPISFRVTLHLFRVLNKWSLL